MIPPRMLKQLADHLTKQTREGSASWRRERSDMQRYIHDLSTGEIVVYYNPSRGGPDTIELAVTEPSGEVIGSLVAVEHEPDYDELADLVFEIQQKYGGAHPGVTNEILRLLNSATPTLRPAAAERAEG
jgi:hypothetical protein